MLNDPVIDALGKVGSN